tara:strand:- start:5768 stop:6604 length:837 start_codon:yes stop_codon:yes gene_type:complete
MSNLTIELKGKERDEYIRKHFRKAPSLPIAAALWLPGSSNRKTGNVPTLWIGRTMEETRASCKGCPLCPKKEGGNGECYAYGSPEYALHSIQRAAAKDPERYTVNRALSNSKRSAKMARLGALGDPGRLPLDYLKRSILKVRAVGLEAVGYTHHWRDLPSLAGWLMASCDALGQVDGALAAGWRVAVKVPWDFLGDNGTGRFKTPGGAAGIVCPAVKTDGGITCNDCRLCDGSKAGPVIAFPSHGPAFSHKLRSRRARDKERTAKAAALLDRLDKGGE